MPSVRDITAADVAEEDPATVNVGQPLSKVRAAMEREDVRTIPVVDGAKFVGMLSYRDLMEKLRTDPSNTDVEGLVHTPPTVESDQNLVELAGLRINSGRKKFALLDEHDRLAGVIGEHHLVDAARETEELQGVSLAAVATQDVVTVDEDERLETARKTMMDKDISRLPVLDKDALSGTLSSVDVLRAMVPRQQMQDGDVKGHKDSLSDIPVRELMRAHDTTARHVVEDLDMPAVDAAGLMAEHNVREVIGVEDGAPVALLTRKDIVNYVAAEEAVDSMLVQLTGPEVPEEKRAIHDKVETAFRGGLGRVVDRPEELTVHMKKYETDGTRHKYSLNFKLYSKQGVTTIKTHDWDLLNAVDAGLAKLERVMRSEKGKKIDEKRDKQREAKYR